MFESREILKSRMQHTIKKTVVLNLHAGIKW